MHHLIIRSRWWTRRCVLVLLLLISLVYCTNQDKNFEKDPAAILNKLMKNSLLEGMDELLDETLKANPSLKRDKEEYRRFLNDIITSQEFNSKREQMLRDVLTNEEIEKFIAWHENGDLHLIFKKSKIISEATQKIMKEVALERLPAFNESLGR